MMFNLLIFKKKKIKNKKKKILFIFYANDKILTEMK